MHFDNIKHHAMHMSKDIENPKTISGHLRNATQAAHTAAEQRPSVSKLIAGSLNLNSYIAYLAQLAYIYEALESYVAESLTPEFLRDKSLYRYGEILKDLEALGVENHKKSHPPLPSVKEYAKRINSLKDADWLKYLAHHYTRYLGDLSGGQIIAKMVAKHYGAKEDQLNFSNFKDIDKPVIYKRQYRDNIDRLNLTEEQIKELIDESNIAYRFNMHLFDELDPVFESCLQQ